MAALRNWLISLSGCLLLSWGLHSAATAADVSYGETLVPPPHSFAYAAELDAYAAWMLRTGDGINESGGTSEAEQLPFIGGSGKIAFPLGVNVLMQFDVDAEKGFTDRTGDNYVGSIVGGGHLAYRTVNGHLLGVFGAVGRTHDTNEDQSASVWALGVEGVGTFGTVDILGQVGYMDASADNLEGLNHAWFGRAVARTWVNQGKTRLTGEVAVASGRQDGDGGPGGVGEPLFLVGWGVEAEHAFSQSLHHTGFGFVRYDGVYFNEDEGAGVHTTVVDHRLLAGFRVRFGGSATGQGTPFSLPRLGQWHSGASALD